MIVQNREIFLLFFTYIFVPGGHILMLHEGSRNGIYAFQNTKTNLENSIFPSPVMACNNARNGGRMTKPGFSGIRLFTVFLLQ